MTNGINDLHLSLGHAVHVGFPDVEYEDRDWDHYRKTKEDIRVKKSRKHTENDIEIYAMFPQPWSSTALGFGGLGGQAITVAYTVILLSLHGGGCCVYFGGRFAYHILKPNDKFFEDAAKRQMVAVKDAGERYERTN